MTEAGEAEIGVRRERRQRAPKVAVAAPALDARPLSLRGLFKRLFGAVSPLLALAAAFEDRRLIVALPFCIILGLIGDAILAFDPSALALVIALVLSLGVVFYNRDNFVALQVAVLGFGVVLGFSLLTFHGLLSGGPMLAYPAYGTYHARVDAVLPSADASLRVIVSQIVPATPQDRVLPARRARLYMRSGPSLRPGDVITGKFRFAPVPGPVVPGGYDFQFHSYFDGIGSFASATGPVEVITRGQESWQRAVDQLRHGIGARIDAALAPPANGIARALVIGDQSQISDETRATMAAAGLAHVLAISGLHLTLVAGGIFAVVRMGLAGLYGFGQRFAVKKIAALAGGGAALFYLMLSGASVSAVRATIMILLVFGAVLVGRRALTMRNVAIAALIVIFLEPASVFRPSFQLSFAAVTALIGVYEMSRGGEFLTTFWGARLLRFFGGMALTSLIAGVATAIFAAYHFQQTAPLGVLGNIAALPIVGFVVLPACIFAVLAMPFGAESVFLQAAAWGANIILRIADFVAGLSAPIAVTPLLGPAALLICLLALGWLAVIPARLRFAGVVLTIPLIMLFGRDVAPDVLIADSSQAVAVRGENGLGLITGRAPSFATTAWAGTYMEPIVGAAQNRQCDASGCVADSVLGFTVATVKRAEAFAEECRSADVVISHLRAPEWCDETTLLVDAENLRLGGVHMLYWNGEQRRFAVRQAIPNPHRAWRVPF